MKKEKYVLHLKESGTLSYLGFTFIGYWTGTSHWAEDICFPGVRGSKFEKDVKVYTSKKRAENAVKKLKDKFTYVKDAVIETLE